MKKIGSTIAGIICATIATLALGGGILLIAIICMMAGIFADHSRKDLG